jgi:alpha-1,3-glucosyltransferase
VYLLRVYCLSPRSVLSIRFTNCVKLGLSLVVVFGAALGPFLALGQGQQLLTRLFPFSRGLCHAYWAPNVWALYSFADRVLIAGMFCCHFHLEHLLTETAAPKLGLTVNAAALQSVTRGLVGDTAFAVLPDIPPRTTFVLTLFFQAVCFPN